MESFKDFCRRIERELLEEPKLKDEKAISAPRRLRQTQPNLLTVPSGVSAELRSGLLLDKEES